MFHHHELPPEKVRALIRRKAIILGGNRRLKIVGQLHCSSGKRMRNINRVFFSSMEEAVTEGYRPCGRCMPEQFKIWKKENKNTSKS